MYRQLSKCVIKCVSFICLFTYADKAYSEQPIYVHANRLDIIAEYIYKKYADLNIAIEWPQNLYNECMRLCSLSPEQKDFSYTFFKEHGLQSDYLDILAVHYAELHDKTYMVFQFPVAHNQDITHILMKFGAIIYHKDIYLKNQGPLLLIQHLYDGEAWIGSYADNFKGSRDQVHYCFEDQQDKPVRVFLFEADSLEAVKKSKEEIRAYCPAKRYSVHINDTHEQTVYLARIIFNDNSIHALNHATNRHCKNFEKYIIAFKQWLKKNNYDPEFFCIDTGAALAAYGLRDCHDLDFLQHRYRELDHDKAFENHENQLKFYSNTKDDIIFNPKHYFYFRGLKFVHLPLIQHMKQRRQLEKDAKDVRLIQKIFK